MDVSESNNKVENGKSKPGVEAQRDNSASEDNVPPKEIGGRGGLDPTRYGDWEKAGRCIDF